MRPNAARGTRSQPPFFFLVSETARSTQVVATASLTAFGVTIQAKRAFESPGHRSHREQRVLTLVTQRCRVPGLRGLRDHECGGGYWSSRYCFLSGDCPNRSVYSLCRGRLRRAGLRLRVPG
ncbi:hypothetical protein CB1_000951008 [Camelus ferus]|nr:hypothetical protein CB1_000951008 [Camelus ferus]